MAGSTRTRPPSLPGGETLARYADLVVGLGANVQPGQVVEIRADLAKRDFVRALAASAYRRGAAFVDAVYFDPWVRRARLLHADPDTLDFVPEYARRRVLRLGELNAARISLAPAGPTDAVADVDPELVARDQFPYLPEYTRVVNENTTNWTGVPCPDPAWARLVFPDLDPDDALARLWEDVLHIVRMDEPDPEAAWRARFAELDRASAWLNERRFDALHFQGPGTELTVGLLAGSKWGSGPSTTTAGVVHAPNIPTEETFTAPDPRRADGVVTSRTPLVVKSGVLVRGLTVRFEGGRAVAIDAESGGEALRTMVAGAKDGDRLGEVALVDRESRIGRTGRVYYTTLLDENAASHMALGSAYPKTVGEADLANINRSPIHVDFMFGGDDVDVTGLTAAGERVAVMRGGSWAF